MSEEQAALPPEERSQAGPWTSWLVVGALLALAIGGGGTLLLSRRPVPALENSGGEWILSYEGRDSVKIVLGQGCSNPGLSSKEGEDVLSWLSEGELLEVEVSCGEKLIILGGKVAEPGQALIVLPNKTCHVIDPAIEPLLELERWEGAIGEGGRCVLWVYRHASDGRGPSFRDFLVQDGQSFGRLNSGSRSVGGESWGFSEQYPTGTRRLDFRKGAQQVSYTLVVGGKKEQANLERTHQVDWNAGDPLPQPTGH